MKITFFDSRPYDRIWFDPLMKEAGHEPRYVENRLDEHTLEYAAGSDGICTFVNDKVTPEIMDSLLKMGIDLILLRNAGFNNVNLKAAYDKKMHVYRVPAYSPAAVAEYAMAMLLTLNRKTNKAYVRTREFNFNIDGLQGMDLSGKTAGIIGTGRIGQLMIDILRGFHMDVVAYDVYPNSKLDINYVALDELLAKSDIITLHCPLSDETKHIINADNIAKMKTGVLLVNTSRGGLMDTQALIDGVYQGKLGGIAMDVYEEEESFFYEDWSDKVMGDRDLARLITFPNVLLTSHQAFLTQEALQGIAQTTVENIGYYQRKEFTPNEVCYPCEGLGDCDMKKEGKSCF